MSRSESDPGGLADGERRFPRRFLLTAGAAAAAVGIAEVVAPNANASSGTTPWVCGGNTGITTDGTNFLGTKNVAPLIFKTTAASTPVERMRITPAGRIGIATAAPSANLDVRGGATTIQALNTNTATTAAGLLASATKGTGVSSSSTDGTGVIAASTNGSGLKASSTNSTGVNATGGPNSYGLVAGAGYCGANGNGGFYGGIFGATNSGGYGSYASGDTCGSYGTGNTYGVYGTGSTGVYGAGASVGVAGNVNSGAGKAVWGHGGQYGVFGDGGSTAGVRGESGYVGAWAQAPSYGMYVLATDTGANQTYGIFAQCSNSASFAVWAAGNANVTGTLYKSAGSFRIDHPLDPERTWLSHSFVESPDMMNVYNGNVVLGSDGTATVELPSYFAVLNRDFRYQLTPIGAHAPVYIASKIKNNAFTIAGGTAGLEVSWQVTGIRQDDYAKAHPIVVEAPKSAADRGTRQFVPPGVKANRMQHQPTASGAPAVSMPKPLTEPKIRRP